eukprot:2319367-Prymnesium_polylepis.3
MSGSRRVASHPAHHSRQANRSRRTRDLRASDAGAWYSSNGALGPSAGPVGRAGWRPVGSSGSPPLAYGRPLRPCCCHLRCVCASLRLSARLRPGSAERAAPLHAAAASARDCRRPPVAPRMRDHGRGTPRAWAD